MHPVSYDAVDIRLFKVRVHRFTQGATKGRVPGQQFASRLAAILLAEHTYGIAATDCFDPGVAYRLWKGDRSVDVLICFHCNNLDVRPNRKAESAGGQLADFGQSTVRTELLKLTKEAFPDDRDIQSLK